MELNADIGEGHDDDAALLALVQRASIACGAHAGDEATMRQALHRCAAAGVAAGAHPGHADRQHFGRRALPLTPALAHALVRGQLLALQALAAEQGLRLRHLKPHGALYHQADAEPTLADAVCAAVRETDPQLLVVGFAGGGLVQAARRLGLQALDEGFADRGYGADGRLLPRDRPGALIADPAAAVAQMQRLQGQGVHTVCVHGDSPGALRIAQALAATLKG
jgi:5-oxoprolinase (ATP-hydrolysing) subunit A